MSSRIWLTLPVAEPMMLDKLWAALACCSLTPLAALMNTSPRDLPQAMSFLATSSSLARAAMMSSKSGLSTNAHSLGRSSTTAVTAWAAD